MDRANGQTSCRLDDANWPQQACSRSVLFAPFRAIGLAQLVCPFGVVLG